MKHIKTFESVSESEMVLLDDISKLISKVSYDMDNVVTIVNWDSVLRVSKTIIEVISNFHNFDADDDLIIGDIIRGSILNAFDVLGFKFWECMLYTAKHVCDFLKTKVDDIYNKYDMYLTAQRYNV